MSRAALALAIAFLAAAPAHAERLHVYLVIVDGLDARFATAERMPALAAAAGPAFGATARGVMPARTNPNHATLLTGVWPQTHGITGNAFWRREPAAPPERLDAAARLEVETLFTVIETTRPALRTVGVFAKPKLARLLGAAPGRQRAPDALWSPEDLPPERRDPTTRYARDAETMGAALALVAEPEPDLVVINIADVDRMGHAHGAASAEAGRAIADADAAIACLLDALRARGRAERSLVIVTADHGFTDLAPSPARPAPVISLGRQLDPATLAGVRLVADGGVEHVYAEGLASGARALPRATAASLARVADAARGVAGVSEVLARLPVPGVPLLGAVHPDWRLDHQRTGELLLVAAPGHQFVDPWEVEDAALLGNHGAGECRVPLVVVGRHGQLRDAAAPSLADVAMTIARLLGVRAPRRVGGAALRPDDLGRPIAGLVAAQSPH